jgi:hypothetical protein
MLLQIPLYQPMVWWSILPAGFDGLPFPVDQFGGLPFPMDQFAGCLPSMPELGGRKAQ